jgi:hypothetical protein
MPEARATEPTLRDAYCRVAGAERALREFGTPASLADLSEAAAREWHALREEERRAHLELEQIARRIEVTRLEFHE